MNVPDARPHSAAVVTCIDAAGITVGFGSGAGLADDGNEGKYAVVYSDEGTLDGPMGDRFADITQAVFVHSVGTGPEQAQWVADKVRRALLLDGVTVEGRSVLYLAHASSQPVQRDDDEKPPMFYAVDEYTLATSPA